MPLSCRLSHRQTSTLRVSYSSDNSQLQHLIKVGGHPPGYAQSIPHYKLPPFITIIHHPPCFSSIQTFFFKQSSTKYIRLFHSRSTKQLPIHSPTYTHSAILSFHILSIWSIHLRTFSPILSSPLHFTILHNSIHSPNTQQTSEVVYLILDLSFYLHIIVSLPYNRTGMSNPL